MNWTSDADSTLVSLWPDTTKSSREIGEVIGVTKNAVIARAARLGLGARGVVNNQHGFKGGRTRGKAFDMWEMDEDERREAIAARASHEAKRQRARNAGKKRLPRTDGTKRLSSPARGVDLARTEVEQKPAVGAVG